MFRSIFITLSLIMLGGVSIPAANAQNCDVAHEVISKLIKPSLGAYSLWDTLYGERDTHEEFKALDFSLDKENVLAAGVRYINKGSDKALILSEVDRRGRPVWSVDHALPGLETVVKLITLNDRYLVLVNRRMDNDKGAVWLGYFDKDGKLVGHAAIADPDFNLQAHDFIVSHDLKSLIVSVSKDPRDRTSDSFSALYWVDSQSRKVTRDVAFALGMENKILALDYHGSSGYIGAGSMRSADGRISGWLIKLNEQGGFIWQKPFPRGLGSRFYDVTEYNDGYIAALGESMPATEDGKRAAWVMMVNADTGDVAWQRYYRDDYNLSGVALGVQDDSQLSVLFNGWDFDNSEDKDYVRLLTMNGRGVILHADSYYNAEGAHAAGLLMGAKNERLIYGHSLVEYQIEQPAMAGQPQQPPEIIRSNQGWIVAGAPAEVYHDPCVKRIEFLQ